MALFIGRLKGRWVHTYSKRLRDKYLKNNYVVVFTLGKGRNGGTKIRGFPKNSIPLSKVERTGIIDVDIRFGLKDKLLHKESLR